MIDGHGDDAYRYEGIRINFSSNIPSRADLSDLKAHLCSCIDIIRSYPEPAPRALETKIAHTISRQHDTMARITGSHPSEVLVTSGATEAIYLIAHTASRLYGHTGKALPRYTVVHPTFSEYDSACRMFGLSEAIDGEICWVCNPNNPTGEVRDEAFLRHLARQHEWLVVDCSYEGYTRVPLPVVSDLPNVICVHSMTKRYAIPGLRLGYITASAPVVRQLRTYCRPWSVNALAIEAGLWLLDHPFRGIDVSACLRETQRLRRAINRIPGIHARETQTNFLLCTIEGTTAAMLKENLARNYGILIRDASNFPGLTPHHFRIATQTREENDTLIKALSDFER